MQPARAGLELTTSQMLSKSTTTRLQQPVLVTSTNHRTMEQTLTLWSDDHTRSPTYTYDYDCSIRLFSFAIVNFSFLLSNIPLSPAYFVYTFQFIRYARTCFAYENFSKQDKLLTKKLMLQGYHESRLKS
jgi:hypothetical protein